MVPLNEFYASLMYTAYCEAVGGRAFNGDALPDWDTFSADPSKEKQVAGWIAAADAVIENALGGE